MRVIHLVAAAAALLPLLSHALTGNQLHELMQGDADGTNKLTAAGYVTGFTDGVAFGAYIAHEQGVALKPPMICLPNGSRVVQAYDVIKLYLAANPAQRHLDAGVLSAYALSRAWPCKQ